MTDYIEEMMKTAGVNLFLDCKRCGAKNFALALCIEVNCKATYPCFTPEKQLDIIKLIVSETIQTIEIDKVGNFYTVETLEYSFEPIQDFTQALAQLTTKLMKANELDKQKVKEILER